MLVVILAPMFLLELMPPIHMAAGHHVRRDSRSMQIIWEESKRLGDMLVYGDIEDRRFALQRLENQREGKTISLGLKHFDITFRTETAAALGRLRAKEALPELLDALISANFVAANNGGDDKVAVMIGLKRQIIKSIEKILGQSFDITDYDNVDQVGAVISIVEHRLKKKN